MRRRNRQEDRNIEPEPLFSRVATSSRASGFPSGVPIPPPHNAEWDPYARSELGNIDVPDSTAQGTIELLSYFFAAGEDITNEVLDAILDLPVGYRITGDLMNTLQGCPLGYFVERLQHRARERGGAAAAREIYSFVLVGNFYRISTEISVDPIPTENPYDNRESDFYMSKRATRNLQQYNFMQFPLGRVIWAGLTAGGEGTDRNVMNYFRNGEDELEDYIRRWGASEGGSDIQTFIFAKGGYIARRYGYLDSNTFPAAIRNSHIMRTAGLRQIILRHHTMAFTFNDVFFDKTVSPFTLYVPGGDSDNCFLESIRWFLLKWEEREFYSSLMADRDFLGNVEGEGGECLHEPFDEDEAMKRIRRTMYRVIDACKPKGCPNVREYLRRYHQGFPTSEMNRIGKELFELKGILLSLWKKNGEGKWENLLSFSLKESVTPSVEIPLFLMTDSGKILNTKEDSDSTVEKFKMEGVCDGSLGHMLHCITVYPAPRFFFQLRREGGGGGISSGNAMGRARTGFCKEVTSITVPLLLDLYEKNRYFPEITFEDIGRFVRSQNHRYNGDEVGTLIFNSSKFKKENGGNKPTSTPSDRKRKRWQEIQEEGEGKPRNFVYAYDLETVDNEGKNQHLVYPPFRKEFVSINYEPLESQIPFSAQWVGVNVSDAGVFLERKIADKKCPLAYGRVGIPHPEYFTTEVVTDYGENHLLGECIESFLVDIAVDTHAQGGKVAYLYATNGSKFDAYVILQFQRFEILKMLKTSRGIMFAALRVPITKPGPRLDYHFKNDDVDGSPKITVILRDISLIVPGSLSRLCKGFQVPAEFCKVDFPIQMINASNCYNPKIMEVCGDYGEKDVCALAVIIQKINLLIGNSVWNPANHTSDKPPVVQFLTCMSMIRESTRLHFQKVLPIFLHPRAVDIPVLRNWVSMAAIGGRVTSYARTYVSHHFEEIMSDPFNKDFLRELHKKIVDEGSSMQCLDFTSLYPFVMDSCPIPMGNLKPISPETCEEHIRGVGCDVCDRLKTLCPQHRYYFGKNDSMCTRYFSIIIVKNVRPSPDKNSLRNLCPRKTYNTSTGKPLGLNYSMETNEEFFKRKEGKEKMLDTQSYSNIDLYWMRRQGFTFEIIGGMTWATTSVYNSFIGPAFQLRIDAKKEGNKLLSDFMKLNYNGAYGITIQQDISDTFFLANLPEEYQQICPLDPRVRSAILQQQHNKNEGGDLLTSEELTGESFYFPNGQNYIQKKKKDHLAEFYADQSPMQVGAAILAYARHVGNLVLFNLESEYDFVYTDTDSIALSDHVIKNDAAIQKLICNRDDAPMGSLKNDHADNNGTEPRIVFGVFGAKKVKGYITLNGEGELRVFNTFKGLNISLDIDGRKIKPEYAEYETFKALLNINESFTSVPVEVQAWKRDLSSGVSIGNHLQNFERETYTNFFQAILPHVCRPCGDIEYLVPHGEACNFHPNAIRISSEDSCSNAAPPRIYESYKEKVNEFVEGYYRGCKEEYHPGTEEYQKILDLFASIL